MNGSVAGSLTFGWTVGLRGLEPVEVGVLRMQQVDKEIFGCPEKGALRLIFYSFETIASVLYVTFSRRSWFLC